MHYRMAPLNRSTKNMAHNYKITSDGTIHVYGMMPNTNQVGWYEYGAARDRRTLRRIAADLHPVTLSAYDVAVINHMEAGSMRALRICLRWLTR